MEWATAAEIADAVAGGQCSALSITDDALARIAKRNPAINAFTTVVSDRARAKARAIDRERGEGRELGPLAGAPFAVKNLFDVKGLPTLAGSKINRDHAPAARDATLIARLEVAGAVLVGAAGSVFVGWAITGFAAQSRTLRKRPDLIKAFILRAPS